MNTQAKVKRTIETIAQDAGLELVDDTQWANTGTWRIGPSDTLTPLVSISYNFQDNYSSFTFVPPFGVGKNGGGNLNYVKHEELDERLIAPVRTVLATAVR